MAEKLFGHTPAGIFGYSHLLGGYAGGQAQYVRVPFANVGPIKVPDGVSDAQALFLSDVLPTGYQAAEQRGITPGDVVAIWGCGPVGQLAIQSAYVLGAERVLAIDNVPERLRMAAEHCRAETIDDSQVDVVERLKELTGGRGPDACIDAVGMEAHASGVMGVYDKGQQWMRIETGRPHALRQALQSCRSGGTVSVPGIYGGFLNAVPMGAVMNRALTVRSGQTHVQRYLRPLLERIQRGELDATFIITHHMPLDQAPLGYQIFRAKRDGCGKVVLDPWRAAA